MELEDIGRQLNAAAEAGDFEKVPALMSQYRSRFDEIWSAMPDTSRGVSRLPEEAFLLHRAVLDRLVEVRTSKAAELRGVKLARPYTRRNATAESWQMTL